MGKAKMVVINALAEVAAGNLDGESEEEFTERALNVACAALRRARLKLHSIRPPILGENAMGHGPQHHLAAVGLAASGQVIGEDLGASHRIVVAKEVGNPQHAVEDVGCAFRRRAPVGAVGG